MKSMSFICPQRLFHKFSGLEINACAGTCLVCVTQSGSYHSSMPFYLLQSSVLVALAASLFQSLTVTDLKNVPKIAQLNEYPYREASGWLKRILKIDLVQNAHLCFYILFYRRCMFYLRERPKLRKNWISNNC